MHGKLYRSRRDRMILGVSGGLADFFRIDPMIVRLGWVLVALASGSGFLVFLGYLLCAIIIPENPYDEFTVETEDGSEVRVTDDRPVRRGNGAMLLGLLLVGGGMVLLAQNLWPWLQLGRYWPAILILFGLLVIGRSFGGDGG
ncbi:MAG: PspC domain-containing protein [Bacillota bacterium]